MSRWALTELGRTRMIQTAGATPKPGSLVMKPERLRIRIEAVSSESADVTIELIDDADRRLAALDTQTVHVGYTLTLVGVKLALDMTVSAG